MSTRSTRPALVGAVAGSLALGGLVTGAGPASAAPADARITEVHYDNAGTDVGEAVEVTAPTAADLTGLSLWLYNGGTGTAYGSPVPVPASDTGVSVVTFGENGLQNGSPDGIALVGPDGVVEFLSYEGVFAAADGPAAGTTSTDIGVQETSSSPAGQSLQRDLASGVWTGPAPSTLGGGAGAPSRRPDRPGRRPAATPR